MTHIFPVSLPLHGLDALADEARREGHSFVDRLIDDWERGTNRFDLPGERLLGAASGEKLLGVGGLNVDPYAGDTRAGRLRHLYVAPEFRNRGIGTQLVSAILEGHQQHFDIVRLRTQSAAADAFYRALGFIPVSEPYVTHVLSKI